MMTIQQAVLIPDILLHNLDHQANALDNGPDDWHTIEAAVSVPSCVEEISASGKKGSIN